jgi:enamine deaminase RidA (YjgF/YER057c/UK114 family)
VIRRDNRILARTQSPWEPMVGYSRAVRVGNTIAVTGTVGFEADGSFSPNAARQTERALEIIRDVLVALDAKLDDVVRTRIFVTDMGQWQHIGQVHGKVLGHVMPATTMVEIRRLIDDRCLVEIEADAIVA